MVFDVVMVKYRFEQSKSSICICLFSIDINECIQSPCHPNAICTNTYGNFTCECKRNYIGNGFFCKPIHDESTMMMI